MRGYVDFILGVFFMVEGIGVVLFRGFGGIVFLEFVFFYVLYNR